MPQASPQWTQRHSTRAQAMQSLCSHIFIPGAGYLEYNSASTKPVRRETLIAQRHPERSNWMLVAGDATKPACIAPSKIEDRTRHWLAPPGGAQPVVMIWVARERAWSPEPRRYVGAKRMAFTAAYLGSHGWRYVKPV